MTQVTASMVKDLRGQTGAGMMDAKKALVENDGNIEASIDWLRTKGLAKAAKKADRTAAEGLVSVATNDAGTYGVAVEINSETDFLARNETFQELVGTITAIAQAGFDNVEALGAADMGGKPVTEVIKESVGKIGENMNLRRFESVSVTEGLVASYVHNAVTTGMGKIGVLVGLQSSKPAAELEALGKQVAMHIAAANPSFLNIGTVDADILDRERTVLIEQAKEQGKPDDIAQKMVEGRIRKYYQENVLTEQVFVIDGETKISKLLGDDITLTGFTRMVLGEGVEVEETDFAAEVAAAANG
ncbi:MAG: elongation factor Ts [Alphaproteobacteria bacterium]|nr:MAG: elongation factor Ts [Alphaproteobacteria bacterium]